MYQIAITLAAVTSNVTVIPLIIAKHLPPFGFHQDETDWNLLFYFFSFWRRPSPAKMGKKKILSFIRKI